MSRLDNFEEILDSYDNFKVDAEAFKKCNPNVIDWREKLPEDLRKKVHSVITRGILYVVHQYPVAEFSPFYNAVLYAAGSSVAEEKYNDIDLVIVGVKKESIDYRMIELFAHHIEFAIKRGENPEANLDINKKVCWSHPVARVKEISKDDVLIDFIIDMSGKTVEEWEYQQAAAKERYVYIKSLRIK